MYIFLILNGNNFYRLFLEFPGYKGIYKKRTNDKVDGCAIYYRDSMFSLNEYALVEYYQPQHRFLNRDNVGIVARFKMKSCNRNIVVANTHLLFNPRRVDIRLAQIQMLLAEIERIAFCCCDRNGYPNVTTFFFIII